MALLWSPYPPPPIRVELLTSVVSPAKGRSCHQPPPSQPQAAEETLQLRLNHCDPSLNFPSPGVSGREVGLRVATPKHIPALLSVIFLPLSWPTSALAPWIPLPGAFQIQQKHFFFFPGKQNSEQHEEWGWEGLIVSRKGLEGKGSDGRVRLRPREGSKLHFPKDQL